jgi:hypothetical protein
VASYVYSAWLGAGGELGLVREPIAKWLRKFAGKPQARYVRGAWIKAGGELGTLNRPAYSRRTRMLRP